MGTGGGGGQEVDLEEGDTGTVRPAVEQRRIMGQMKQARMKRKRRRRERSRWRGRGENYKCVEEMWGWGQLLACSRFGGAELETCRCWRYTIVLSKIVLTGHSLLEP